MAGGGTYVDYRASLGYVGTVLKYVSLAPLFPLAVALFYGEDPVPFVATAVVAGLAGLALEALGGEGEMGHREAFLMVSLTWFAVPVVGAVPYLVAGNGTVAAPVDALFESMSGFTTTGSTVLGEISFERHGRAILLWRQFTQWMGGMGIIVLMVAILPELSVNGAQLMREEAPGLGVEKLTPRIAETARALWGIYLGFTVAAAVVYYGLGAVGLADNMGVYNAVAHALTTMPTGGFSPEARSAEAFSPAVQWAMVAFMVVAGTNFALFWHVRRGDPRKLVENPEFRSYLGVMALLTLLVAGLLFSGTGLAETPANVPTIPGNLEGSLRQAAFQAAAVVTTTGYASMDFNTWSPAAQVVLLLAMFLGGSAGSAAGSVKIVRWLMVRRAASRELFTTVHPEAVRTLRFSGGVVDEDTIRGVLVFVTLFIGIFAVSTVVVFLDALGTGLDLTAIEAMSVAIATLGNVGPGFGLVGPMDSFQAFSPAGKLYMVFLMWIGRLEVVTVLVVFTPAYWRR